MYSLVFIIICLLHPTTPCQVITCEHDNEDLRFLTLIVTDVRQCEFSFESKRRSGILQLTEKFETSKFIDSKTLIKTSHKLTKGDIGVVLYCSVCNTALAIKIWEEH